MRWDKLRVETERERPLPGLAVDTVRTFDAPEALGIRFHEVRAKSALNHVPNGRFGFNWTYQPLPRLHSCLSITATALRAARTAISTSTPGGTSSARSSSR